MNLVKDEFETREEFIYRCYSSKVELGLTNKELADVINKELGTSYQESYLRGIYSNYSIGFEDGFEKALASKEVDLVEEIKLQKVELQKEKVKLQDQKREYLTYLRADARFEHLKDSMITEIQKLEPFKIDTVKPTYREEDRHAVLMLSDWHVGIKEENYWNVVNTDILKKRIAILQGKVIEACKTHKVETLHVEMLGDLVNGLIHVTTRISNEEDVVQQVITCSELLSVMIVNLAKEIPTLKIYSATGNHGRCVANAKESLDTENFEKLITWYLESRLENIDNIQFCGNIHDDNIIVCEFLNETIFAVHGHEDKIGSVVSDLSQMLKIFPTEVHMGHFHSYYEKTDHDMTVVVNGTLSGTDKYAKRIRKSGSPMQNLMIYNNEGRECTYKIKLG